MFTRRRKRGFHMTGRYLRPGRKLGGGFFDTIKGLVKAAVPYIKPIVSNFSQTGKICIDPSNLKGSGLIKADRLHDKGLKSLQAPRASSFVEKSKGMELADRLLSDGPGRRRKTKADDMLKQLISGKGLNVI